MAGRKQVSLAEELTTTITLDHHQCIPLNFLISRKSVPTIQAFPSPADHGPSFGGTGIHDLVIKTGTFRALHKL